MKRRVPKSWLLRIRWLAPSRKYVGHPRSTGFNVSLMNRPMFRPSHVGQVFDVGPMAFEALTRAMEDDQACFASRSRLQKGLLWLQSAASDVGMGDLRRVRQVLEHRLRQRQRTRRWSSHTLRSPFSPTPPARSRRRKVGPARCLPPRASMLQCGRRVRGNTGR